MSYPSENIINGVKKERVLCLILGIIIILAAIALFGYSFTYKISTTSIFANFSNQKIPFIMVMLSLILLNFGIYLIMFWKNVKSFYSQSYIHYSITTIIGSALVCINSLFGMVSGSAQMMTNFFIFFIVCIKQINTLSEYSKYTKTESFRSQMIRNSQIARIYPYISLIIWILLSMILFVGLFG